MCKLLVEVVVFALDLLHNLQFVGADVLPEHLR